jgi:hypothetical protein
MDYVERRSTIKVRAKSRAASPVSKFAIRQVAAPRLHLRSRRLDLSTEPGFPREPRICLRRSRGGHATHAGALGGAATGNPVRMLAIRPTGDVHPNPRVPVLMPRAADAVVPLDDGSRNPSPLQVHLRGYAVHAGTNYEDIKQFRTFDRPVESSARGSSSMPDPLYGIVTVGRLRKRRPPPPPRIRCCRITCRRARGERSGPGRRPR